MPVRRRAAQGLDQGRQGGGAESPQADQHCPQQRLKEQAVLQEGARDAPAAAVFLGTPGARAKASLARLPHRRGQGLIAPLDAADEPQQGQDRRRGWWADLPQGLDGRQLDVCRRVALGSRDEVGDRGGRLGSAAAQGAGRRQAEGRVVLAV
jgi:hypothetical protein